MPIDNMDWSKKYQDIVGVLGISPQSDAEATGVLDGLIPKYDFSLLEALIKNKNVLVFGCGPSLKKDVCGVRKQKLNLCCTVVAVDGAVRALLEEGITPDINVTDLDGDVKSIIKANGLGCVTVVHAHGDNIPLLREVVPKLAGVVLGTTQTAPTKKIKNFGGFTDGDRAVYLVEHFKPKSVVLFGMDFGVEVGEYSGRYDMKVKLKKLGIGKKLLEELSGNSNTLMLNATSGGAGIRGVPRISLGDLSGVL